MPSFACSERLVRPSPRYGCALQLTNRLPAMREAARREVLHQHYAQKIVRSLDGGRAVQCRHDYEPSFSRPLSPFQMQ